MVPPIETMSPIKTTPSDKDVYGAGGGGGGETLLLVGGGVHGAGSKLLSLTKDEPYRCCSASMGDNFQLSMR